MLIFLMDVGPEMLYSMALLDWLWARDSVRKFAQVNLEHHSSMLSHTISTAEIIASKEEGRFLSILRRSPRHVPLRYAHMKSKCILAANVYKRMDQGACALRQHVCTAKILSLHPD